MMDHAELPPILTRDQVAELLGCDAQTVEVDARRKRLPGVKFGRGWVFPRDELFAHLNRMAHVPFIDKDGTDN